MSEQTLIYSISCLALPLSEFGPMLFLQAYAVSPGKSMGFSQSWFCQKANACFLRTAARNTVENDNRGEYCKLIVTRLSHWLEQIGMLRPSVLLVNQV